MNIKELKQDAKQKIKDNFKLTLLPVMIIYLIYTFIKFIAKVIYNIIAIIIIGVLINKFPYKNVEIFTANYFLNLILIILTLWIVAIVRLALYGGFMKIAKTGKATMDDFIAPLRKNLLKKIGTIYLSNLYSLLWSLLIIPLPIKIFSYSQVISILVDDEEDIYFNEAITKSRKLMDGHKLELLGVFISFLLWFIGEKLTFRLLEIYSTPYMNITLANYYLELKNKYNEKINNNEITEL